MQNVLTSTESKNVHLFIVWLPMLRTDDRESAVERTKEFSDPRVSYYWDENAITGMGWQQLLGLHSTAWDVYFLYPPGGTAWSNKPAQPFFWMHQLRGVTSAPLLDQDEFKLKMLQLLKAEKQKQNSGV
jgi:hypothetical protein